MRRIQWWSGAALVIGFAALAGAHPQADKAVPVPALPEFDRSDPVVYGRQLADYQDRRSAGWIDEVADGELTLFDATGDSVRRTFARRVLEHAVNGDKVIVEFTGPPEVKGVAALTFERPGSSDDNWLYLPSTKRVRRISGANNTASFQGTEFTYEDLGTPDPREYRWRFIEEAELRAVSSEGTEDDSAPALPVYRLEAKPIYDDTGYARLVVDFHRTEWRPERVVYYDLAGRKLKTKRASHWKKYHDRFWREGRVEMTNHQTAKRTVISTGRRFLDLSRYKSKRTGKYRKNLTDAMFTTRALQR